MPQYTQPIQNLIDQFASLPGIGLRTAERIAFHILKQPRDDALKLASAVHDVKTNIRHCSVCFNLTQADVDPCPICTDSSRDQALVCVVEQPKDLLALEATGLFKGVYHVLLGRIAPLDDQHASDITIDQLMERLEGGSINEIIMGTNPNFDGDGTALHIQHLVKERFPQIAVTRLARGLSSGTQIEYANKNVLADAISQRQRL